MIEIGLDCHIEIDPAVRAGKPRLAGTRITVSDIVIMHLHLGQSLESIAQTYDLPLSGVYAALAYYYDHQHEIDQSIADEEAFYTEAVQNHTSPLREGLKTLKIEDVG